METAKNCKHTLKHNLFLEFEEKRHSQPKHLKKRRADNPNLEVKIFHENGMNLRISF